MAIEIAAFDTLDAVAADAEGALDRHHQASLFDRLEWYALTLRYCPPPGQPLIVRGRDAYGALWLFLMREDDGVTGLTSWYSLETGLAASGTPSPVLAKAIAVYLRRTLRLDRLRLAPLSTQHSALIEPAFRKAGWHGRSTMVSTNWSVTIDRDWDAYWQARPSRLRNTIARKSNAISCEIYSQFQDDIWLSYETVYKTSWKPEEGSFAFLRALAEQEAAAGTLRIGLGLLQGKPVAAQLWLVENGRATIHKLAHDEAYRAFSPGSVLSAALFRHVITADHVRHIDFGTGDDSYKADWMDTPSPLYSVDFYNPVRLRGLIGAVRSSAASLVRRVRNR